jgi:hypothetical protein
MSESRKSKKRALLPFYALANCVCGMIHKGSMWWWECAVFHDGRLRQRISLTVCCWRSGGIVGGSSRKLQKVRAILRVGGVTITRAANEGLAGPPPTWSWILERHVGKNNAGWQQLKNATKTATSGLLSFSCYGKPCYSPSRPFARALAMTPQR